MNFSPYIPYGISQVTPGLAPRDVRRWTRLLRVKVRKIFEYWGASRVDGHFPPF
jgi:hypothetical protein